MSKAKEDIWQKIYSNLESSKLHWAAYIQQIRHLQTSQTARKEYAKNDWKWILYQLPKHTHGTRGTDTRTDHASTSAGYNRPSNS